MMQKLIELKGEIDKSTIISGDFPFTANDKAIREPTRRRTEQRHRPTGYNWHIKNTAPTNSKTHVLFKNS